MIRIEKVKFIPKLAYTTYSWTELALVKDKLKEIERDAQGIWIISEEDTPLMVVGVTKSSLLQPPRLWFLLCENFLGPCVVMYLRGLRNALIHLDRLFPKIVTYVEKDWAKGQKFAKFCGFKPTKTELEMYGRKLVLMER